MATTNPAPRPRRARRSPPGGLDALRRELWHALRRVGEVLDNPNADPADVCRAGNTLAALANAYRGVTEAADLLPRLEAVEELIGERARA